jgi:hypothetical protein
MKGSWDIPPVYGIAIWHTLANPFGAAKVWGRWIMRHMSGVSLHGGGGQQALVVPIYDPKCEVPICAQCQGLLKGSRCFLDPVQLHSHNWHIINKRPDPVPRTESQIVNFHVLSSVSAGGV